MKADTLQNYPSYLNDILTAIQIRLQGIAGLPVVIVRNELIRAPDDPKYIVVIAPSTDEFGETAGFVDAENNNQGRRTREIIYSFNIGLLLQANQAWSTLDPIILWFRENVRQRFDNPQLQGAATVYDTDLHLGTIVDESGLAKGWNGTSITLEVSSIEPATGTAVSNQIGN